jgi:hypothetical protein
VKLTAHNGKVSQFKQALATPGCDPLATLKLIRLGRRYRLAAVLTAARQGPSLTAARLKLPKALRAGKHRPKVRVDGKLVRASKARRALAPRLHGSARRIRIVWSGLTRARGHHVGKRLSFPVTLKDARGKKTTLKVRVSVRAG